MKLYKGFLLLVLCIAALLCGCKAEVATKSQLLHFAKDTYGKAECLDYYVDGGKSYIILKDAEYGFEYSVWSNVSDFDIDGSKFGEFESKNSDFLEKYIAYIQTEFADKFADLEDKYDCYTEWNEYFSPNTNYDDSIISIYISNEENAEIIARGFYDIINEVDTRQFFSKGNIDIQYGAHYIGGYSFSDDRYNTVEEINIKWAMENAMNIMNVYMDLNIDSVDELTYLYMEAMDVHDIPGYDMNNTSSRITDTAESLANTAVYHFEYNKNEWIIADCIVAPYGNLHVYKLEQ